MIRPLRSLTWGALALTAACAPAPGPGLDAGLFDTAEAPEGAPPGTCWARAAQPAVVETVTEQVLVRPEVRGADGAVTVPAQFRTETRQRILREREVAWFERPCPEALTPDFAASLQRALKVRGAYDGPVTGRLDAATGAAVRRWQVARGGPDSPVPSRATAEALGLVAMRRPSEAPPAE
jgi:hypothetical protein